MKTWKPYFKIVGRHLLWNRVIYYEMLSVLLTTRQSTNREYFSERWRYYISLEQRNIKLIESGFLELAWKLVFVSNTIYSFKTYISPKIHVVQNHLKNDWNIFSQLSSNIYFNQMAEWIHKNIFISNRCRRMWSFSLEYICWAILLN